MNNRYIVIGAATYGGAWGAGDSVAKALRNYRKAGGTQRAKLTVMQFRSELPFAPSNRPATEAEADAYVTNDSTHWVRCERTMGTLQAASNPTAISWETVNKETTPAKVEYVVRVVIHGTPSRGGLHP